VVGSDSGEIPNLIRQSGGGLVFRERDPEALAGALRMMVTEPQKREEWASRGRAWVAENVSLDAAAKRMVGIFEDTLRQSSSRSS
jgi:glycosyltransferase involved in cell wall biosynthesis